MEKGKALKAEEEIWFVYSDDDQEEEVKVNLTQVHYNLMAHLNEESDSEVNSLTDNSECFSESKEVLNLMSQLNLMNSEFQKIEAYTKIKELEDLNFKRGQTEQTLKILTNNQKDSRFYKAKPGLGLSDVDVLKKAPENLYNFKKSSDTPVVLIPHILETFVKPETSLPETPKMKKEESVEISALNFLIVELENANENFGMELDSSLIQNEALQKEIRNLESQIFKLSKGKGAYVDKDTPTSENQSVEVQSSSSTIDTSTPIMKTDLKILKLSEKEFSVNEIGECSKTSSFNVSNSDCSTDTKVKKESSKKSKKLKVDKEVKILDSVKCKRVVKVCTVSCQQCLNKTKTLSRNELLTQAATKLQCSYCHESSFSLKPKSSKKRKSVQFKKMKTSAHSKVNQKAEVYSYDFIIKSLVRGGLAYNIFSISQFTEKKCNIEFDANYCFIIDQSGAELTKAGRMGLLYGVHFPTLKASKPVCLISKTSTEESWLWPRRLSHLHFQYLNKLRTQHLVTGLPDLKIEQDSLCSACEKGKMKRSSHKLKMLSNCTKCLELIHMDLYGPMRTQSINGKKYILVMVDEYSRYTWLEFLRQKSEAPDLIIKFIKKIQVLLQSPVQQL
ncbi:hypothetical protein L6452_26300 [Arctium lappa]|uniref:Uncharacterized protein n=1 Tax=Arctium lappa TaxID=4217 RepID=A0ACB9AD59_ARCLA|nr:hypothetical protein L6452_26300 [Arctium lappa]